MRRGSEELYELEDCTIVHETDDAVLIATDEGERHWLPFSQVREIKRRANAATASVVMTAWIAKQKGLI